MHFDFPPFCPRATRALAGSGGSAGLEPGDSAFELVVSSRASAKERRRPSASRGTLRLSLPPCRSQAFRKSQLVFRANQSRRHHNCRCRQKLTKRRPAQPLAHGVSRGLGTLPSPLQRSTRLSRGRQSDRAPHSLRIQLANTWTKPVSQSPIVDQNTKGAAPPRPLTTSN